MWTHKINAIFRSQGQTQVEVAYVNGVDPTINFYIKYTIASTDELKQFIQNQLNASNLGDSLYSNLTLGQPIDLTINPTQEDINRQLYFTLLNKWIRVQEDIKRGLLKGDESTVTQLQADLKAAYKPEYSGL